MRHGWVQVPITPEMENDHAIPNLRAFLEIQARDKARELGGTLADFESRTEIPEHEAKMPDGSTVTIGPMIHYRWAMVGEDANC